MDVCRSRFWHTGNQIQHVAVIGFTGGRHLIDHPIDIGQLVTSVYEEVQYEAQTFHLRHSRFLALRDDKSPREVHREV